MSALSLVRLGIRRFRAYALPRESAPPISAKLDFNEAPFDPPDEIKRRVLQRLLARRWSHYPELGSPRLKASIARTLGRRPEEIVVGNGSGEVILAAVSVFAGSGGTILSAPPTFSLYAQMAAIAGASVTEVPRIPPSFDVDEEAFVARAGFDRRVPLVSSPNNPTGGVVSRAFLERLLAAAPVVLLDQAYVDFAAPEDDALPLLEEHPNLVVFRTLSKAYSAAGFRIGYAVAAPELAREIEKAVLPFSVDLAAEELAVALLEDGDVPLRNVSTVVAERERVASALAVFGARVAPSRSNFLFFSPPSGDAPGVRRELLARGVLVRDMTSAAPGHLRVSIGSPEENDAFLSALQEIR